MDDTNNTDGAALLPVTPERCTCAEAFGEDPNCTLHGVETAWALENMLPSEWQTQVIELRQMLNEASQSHSLPGDVEAYLVERLEGEGYGPARRIVDAQKYDPTKADHWADDAQKRHRVTALAALTPSAVSGDAGEGLAAIAAERKRQIEVEGWSTEHDDEHADCQMAGAAACYAMSAIPHWAKHEAIRLLWPWSKDWWKPRSHRENLVRAGALIAAEIERIDRFDALPQMVVRNPDAKPTPLDDAALSSDKGEER